MKKTIVTTAVLLAGLAWGGAAAAGPYTDDVSKCLVRATSVEDKHLLVQWIFSAMSTNPAIKGYANITVEERTDISRKAGALFVRLITKDCRSETVLALKYEGTSVFESSFSVLGGAAMTDLMSDPATQVELNRLGENFDKKAIEDLAKEAGRQ